MEIASSHGTDEVLEFRIKKMGLLERRMKGLEIRMEDLYIQGGPLNWGKILPRPLPPRVGDYGGRKKYYMIGSCPSIVGYFMGEGRRRRSC
jgi:hypothetical protein